MSAGSNLENERIRYLLGLCSEDERRHIESEYFEDEDAFEKMLTAEDDLIDAYARGELSSEQRRRFEKHFLTSLRQRDRVRFARALARSTSSAHPLQPKPRVPFFEIFGLRRSGPFPVRLAIGVAMITLIVFSSWLFLEWRKLSNGTRESRDELADAGRRTEPSQPREEIKRTRTADNPPEHDNQRTRRSLVPKAQQKRQNIARREPAGRVETNRNTQDASLGSIFESKKMTQLRASARNVANLLSLQPAITPSFTLVPRSLGKSTFSVARAVYFIKLQLQLEKPAEPREYRAAIETADGHSVRSINWMESLRSEHNILTPEITSRDVPAGDYVLLLAAKDANGSFVRVAEYSFKIFRN